MLDRRQLGLGLLAMPALSSAARAEVSSIRLGKQYGLPFLPQMVMESQRLIEKHAAKNGLPSLVVNWLTLSGPGALNEALLSGSMEFVNIATPALATLWDKTHKTRSPVKALCTVQAMPYTLVSRNPGVKTIADLGDGDRIAVPTVKISLQAMMLQMAAAKLWGFDSYDRLDRLTVSLGHPDALAAMLSGRSEISAHFCVAPYQYYELAHPGMHQVLKTYDIVGGPHTNGIQVTTEAFQAANPAICRSVFAAHEEANAFIKAKPAEAAEIYTTLSRDKKATPAEFVAMITDPDIDYTTAPKNMMTMVDFMHRSGRIKALPSSWKDMFLPEAHALAGT